jgi:hypothetical protein
MPPLRKQILAFICECGLAFSSSQMRPTPATVFFSLTRVRHVVLRLSVSRLTINLTDIAFGDTAVRRGIVDGVSAAFPGVYDATNIALVGTHQHSGVGGFFEDLLPQITSLGYVNESAQAIITGSVLAAKRAHASLAPGSLELGNTTIVEGNANRSPSAYLANPAEERALYEYNTDKDMTLLRCAIPNLDGPVC